MGPSTGCSGVVQFLRNALKLKHLYKSTCAIAGFRPRFRKFRPANGPRRKSASPGSVEESGPSTRCHGVEPLSPVGATHGVLTHVDESLLKVLGVTVDPLVKSRSK